MKITLIFLFLTFSISQWIIGENGQGELGTGQSGQSAGNVREGPIFYNSALTNQGLQIINLCQGETFSLAISSNGSVFGTGANWVSNFFNLRFLEWTIRYKFNYICIFMDKTDFSITSFNTWS